MVTVVSHDQITVGCAGTQVQVAVARSLHAGFVGVQTQTQAHVPIDVIGQGF